LILLNNILVTIIDTEGNVSQVDLDNCSTADSHRTIGFQVLGQTQDHRHRVLVAAAKNIKNWFVKVRKIKAIYHTLNLFNLDVTQKCLIAECWVPVLDIETIQLALRRGTVSNNDFCCFLCSSC
jgi:vacuolar-type H+-ATPase subunit I/STV1